MLRPNPKILFFIILLNMAMITTIAYATDISTDIVLIINDELYSAVDEEQAKPEIIEDRIYVPLRLISTALGYEVQWLPDTQQITIMTAGQGVDDRPLNNTEAIQIIINGQALTIPDDAGKPYITDDGYTMLPLRVVGNALNCNVVWESGMVIVTEIIESPITATVNVETGLLDKTYYNLTILGEATATQAQIEAFLTDKEKALRQSNQFFVEFPPHIAALYLELGQKYNIRGDIALAQALKETGYFQFQGSVQWYQNNYCGLGATGIVLTGDEPLNGVDPLKAFYLEGVHGLSFASPAFGVEAHLQHLYAYATTVDLPTSRDLIDPRFKYVQRGVSPRWIDLNGRWAVPGDGYGESILDDYWMAMLQY